MWGRVVPVRSTVSMCSNAPTEDYIMDTGATLRLIEDDGYTPNVYKWITPAKLNEYSNMMTDVPCPFCERDKKIGGNIMMDNDEYLNKLRRAVEAVISAQNTGKMGGANIRLHAAYEDLATPENILKILDGWAYTTSQLNVVISAVLGSGSCLSPNGTIKSVIDALQYDKPNKEK